MDPISLIAVPRSAMRLTTLMDILEREIGASPSARSKLAQLVAERGQQEKAGKAGSVRVTSEARPDGRASRSKR
jgi:hypothetical protein